MCKCLHRRPKHAPMPLWRTPTPGSEQDDGMAGRLRVCRHFRFASWAAAAHRPCARRAPAALPLATALLLTLACSPAARACTSLLVGAGATTDGSVYIARTEDTAFSNVTQVGQVGGAAGPALHQLAVSTTSPPSAVLFPTTPLCTEPLCAPRSRHAAGLPLPRQQPHPGAAGAGAGIHCGSGRHEPHRRQPQPHV